MPMQPIGGPLNLDTSIGQPLQMPAPQPKKKGGMFAGADWGSALQALIGGALASKGNPGGQFLLNMLNQKRQQALEESQYQGRRQDKLADYGEMQRMQAQYGAPPAPHYFEDNSGNQWAIGPDGKPQMVHKDDLPFKLVPNGLGGVVPVDLRSLMQGQGQQGLPEIGTEMPDPRKQGGPAPQGPGGFPRPY